MVHILHQAKSEEPHTVGDLLAPFSYCVEGLVRQKQLVEDLLRPGPEINVFKCHESNQMLWMVDWARTHSINGCVK